MPPGFSRGGGFALTNRNGLPRTGRGFLRDGRCSVAAAIPGFVTIDPERGTPARRNDVPLFHSRLAGLTGSPAQVAPALRAFRVLAGSTEAAARAA